MKRGTKNDDADIEEQRTRFRRIAQDSSKLCRSFCEFQNSEFREAIN